VSARYRPVGLLPYLSWPAGSPGDLGGARSAERPGGSLTILIALS
jgi:hypothetical protein